MFITFLLKSTFNKINYICFALLFLSCFAPTKIREMPFINFQPKGYFEKVTVTEKEKVWTNIIEFFAKSGIPIELIDKSSGFIKAKAQVLTVTTENKNGIMRDSSAYVIALKQYDVVNKVYYFPDYAEGYWNIFIKSNLEGNTVVNINLTQIVGIRKSYVLNDIGTAFKAYSTGRFEESMFKIIK